MVGHSFTSFCALILFYFLGHDTGKSSNIKIDSTLLNPLLVAIMIATN